MTSLHPSRPAPPFQSDPQEQQLARRLVLGLPVSAWREGLPPLAWRVRGRPTSSARRLDLTLRDLAALRLLARELPGHLTAPEVWQLSLPARHSIEFVCGYQTARNTCLPRGGVFTPASGLSPVTLPCPYPANSQERAAFLAGARQYLACVPPLHPAHRAG